MLSYILILILKPLPIYNIKTIVLYLKLNCLKFISDTWMVLNKYVKLEQYL